MMAENSDDSLHLRLRNCLQTILELEPELERLEMGAMLTTELDQLKTFIQRLDTGQLHEEDVNRIEDATTSFLNELRMPMSLLEDTAGKRGLMQ